MYYCYVLQSLLNGKYYIGSTKNLQLRLNNHNKSLVRSTSFGKPWRIAYYEKFIDLKQARKRELQIKHWKSRKSIERLIKFNSQNRGSSIP